MSPRGAGYLFGHDIVTKWNMQNGLSCIARAHQLVMDGYKYMFNQALVTVWSAPNYCYRCGNVAALMEVDEEMRQNFKIFEAAPAVRSPASLVALLFSLVSLFRRRVVFLPSNLSLLTFCKVNLDPPPIRPLGIYCYFAVLTHYEVLQVSHD